MSPQVAPLLHFPGRVIRQSLPPAAVAVGLDSLPSARCQSNSTRPLTSRSSLSALAIAIFSGLLCNTAFAATHITSLSVSATVVSGCQVSSASAEPASSGPNSWSAPVSVVCSLPVAYQVSVSSNSQMDPGISHGMELAGLSSGSQALAGLPGYAQARDLDSPRVPNSPIDHRAEAPGEPAYSLTGVSSGSPAVSADAKNGVDRPADTPNPGTMTVTIVY
jgi:hypothetical protein